jgi:hypothetical protein
MNSAVSTPSVEWSMTCTRRWYRLRLTTDDAGRREALGALIVGRLDVLLRAVDLDQLAPIP